MERRERQAQTRLPGPVRAWLQRLCDGDLDGLVGLYHEEARLDALREDLRGRDEIRDHLAIHWRRLKGLQLGSTQLLDAASGIAFETTLHTRLGEVRVRHDVELQGDHILVHRLKVVSYKRPFLGWSTPADASGTAADASFNADAATA